MSTNLYYCDLVGRSSQYLVEMGLRPIPLTGPSISANSILLWVELHLTEQTNNKHDISEMSCLCFPDGHTLFFPPVLHNPKHGKPGSVDICVQNLHPKYAEMSTEPVDNLEYQ